MIPEPDIRIPEDNIGPNIVNHGAVPGMGEQTVLIHDNELNLMFKALEPFTNARKSRRMKQTGFHILLLSAVMFCGASTAQSGLPIRGPDYFRDATDLAATLGAAHAIRVKCNGRDDQYWRRYMSDMLKYEAPNRGAVRSSLVDAFNEAFTSAGRIYQTCDNRAVEAEADFAVKGQEIATRMATHYFPQPPERQV